jgi:hypothetical protein
MNHKERRRAAAEQRYEDKTIARRQFREPYPVSAPLCGPCSSERSNG